MLLCLLLPRSLLLSIQTLQKRQRPIRSRWLSFGGVDAYYSGLVCFGLRVYKNALLGSKLLIYIPHFPESISKRMILGLMNCCGVFWVFQKHHQLLSCVLFLLFPPKVLLRFQDVLCVQNQSTRRKRYKLLIVRFMLHISITPTLYYQKRGWSCRWLLPLFQNPNLLHLCSFAWTCANLRPLRVLNMSWASTFKNKRNSAQRHGDLGSLSSLYSTATEDDIWLRRVSFGLHIKQPVLSEH